MVENHLYCSLTIGPLPHHTRPNRFRLPLFPRQLTKFWRCAACLLTGNLFDLFSPYLSPKLIYTEETGTCYMRNSLSSPFCLDGAGRELGIPSFVLDFIHASTPTKIGLFHHAFTNSQPSVQKGNAISPHRWLWKKIQILSGLWRT